MTRERLSYEDSIQRIRELGFLQAGEQVVLCNQMPVPEDEGPLGLSFFRTFIEDANLNDLSIPRTFFGRSEISKTTFRNSDLSESNLRWNDFIEVDFTDALLVRADLRASNYTRVKFVSTDLRGADLRLTAFEDCVFENAIMDGALVTRSQEEQLGLSATQSATIDWQDDHGPEPSGG